MTASVYVIQSEYGPIKIGVSRHPPSRLYGITQGQPYSAKVVHSVSDPEIPATAIERAAHGLLSRQRRRGEWFDVTPEQAIEAIASAIDLIKNPKIEETSSPVAKAPRVPVERIPADIPRPLLRAIDDYRFSQRLPSRAEAIRQLIELGLQTTLADDASEKERT